jgi:hypothetical protein
MLRALVSRAAGDLLEIADDAAQIAGPNYEAYLLTRRGVDDWLWKHLVARFTQSEG